MNILTFDIEEWYLEFEYLGNRTEAYIKYNSYLNRILDMLDERNIKATFFCLGAMAREFPNEISAIAKRGHDIGCHSDKHIWLNKLSYKELLKDSRIAIDSLEQLIGKKVNSYRAPAFTIGDSNKFALEVLVECGIERDSSIFPAEHAIGGFDKFGQKEPCIIRYNGIELKEFPICTTKILGKNIVYSGGGYFRFFPFWFIKREMNKNDYNMTYFHIGDFVGGGKLDNLTFEAYYRMPANWKNKKLREYKTNIGVKNAYNKLLALIESTNFISLEQANNKIDWNTVPVLEL